MEERLLPVVNRETLGLIRREMKRSKGDSYMESILSKIDTHNPELFDFLDRYTGLYPASAAKILYAVGVVYKALDAQAEIDELNLRYSDSSFRDQD
jgi:hypothetical protein